MNIEPEGSLDVIGSIQPDVIGSIQPDHVSLTTLQMGSLLKLVIK
jgi:hypothetical protein